MDAERNRRVMAIFQKSCEMEPEQRAVYLDDACGQDRGLRDEVEAMLALDQGHGSTGAPVSVGEGVRMLAADMTGGRSSEAADAEVLPERIGQYRIIRKIGEGGMGVVFLGMQENPQRTVALKVLKPGIAAATALRRFGHEAQVLGWLQHPGIARIYEARTEAGEDGPPFISMEYIEGRRLTAHAVEQQLPVRQRLQLFVKVCDAVAHAHQRGIIHRDLKPSNILVEEHPSALDDTKTSRRHTESDSSSGGVGQPKILDFGVARLLDSELQAHTLQTGAGEIIGTLAYMSPEQAAGENREVDTRSDVYALGVLLYELLTGRLPHDITRHSLIEAARVIRDESPIGIGTINRSYRGDLDTISGKALEKDKTRRYQTASELAADVTRYLAGDPISARRDSGWYVLQTTLRRHKLPVAIAVAFLLLITGSSISLAFMYHNKERERLRAEDQSARAVEAQQKAEDNAARAHTIIALMEELLVSADPNQVKGRDYTVLQLLDDYQAQLGNQLRDQPLVEATLRETMGKVYRSLGNYDVAMKNLQRAVALRQDSSGGSPDELADVIHALAQAEAHAGKYADAEASFEVAIGIRRELHGEDHLSVADSLTSIGALMEERGQYKEAEPILRRALATRERLLGEDHPDVAVSLHALATLMQKQARHEESEALYRRALDILRKAHGERHPSLAKVMRHLGELLEAVGEYDNAERLFRDVLAMLQTLLGEEHPDVATAMHHLAALLHGRGRHEAAEPIYRDALAMRRKLLAPSHPDIAVSLVDLAQFLEKTNRREASETACREALAIFEAAHGRTHPSFAICLELLGILHNHKGDFEAARDFTVQAIETKQERLGREHPNVASSLNNYASLLNNAGRYAEAEPYAREAVAILEKTYGDTHPDLAIVLNNLSLSIGIPGDLSGAAALLERAVDIMRKVHGERSPQIVQSLRNLARCREMMKEIDTAIAHYRESISILKEAGRHDDPLLAMVLENLANALQSQSKPAEAEPVLEEILVMQRRNLPEKHPAIGGTLARLGNIALTQGRFSVAEERLRDCLDIRTAALPEGHWLRHNTMSMLGAALTGQSRFEEAEPLVVEGFQGLRRNPKAPANRTREAFERGVSLYEAWAKPDEAARWRSELSSNPQ